MTGVAFPNESAEHRAARDRLLAREVALRREMEAVARERRALPPGGPVPTDYRFGAVGPGGSATTLLLSELFGDASSILVYQMMFPRHSTDGREPAAAGETAKLPLPDQPCPSCVALVDQLNAAAPHFEAAGGRFFVLAATPIERLAALARDRGWTHLRLLSAAGTSFKSDYASERDGEQLPVTSVFQRDEDGTIRHFWSSELTFAPSDPGEDPRGQGTIEPFWNMLDLMPDGRPDFAEQLQYACCRAPGGAIS